MSWSVLDQIKARGCYPGTEVVMLTPGEATQIVEALEAARDLRVELIKQPCTSVGGVSCDESDPCSCCLAYDALRAKLAPLVDGGGGMSEGPATWEEMEQVEREIQSKPESSFGVYCNDPLPAHFVSIAALIALAKQERDRAVEAWAIATENSDKLLGEEHIVGELSAEVKSLRELVDKCLNLADPVKYAADIEYVRAALKDSGSDEVQHEGYGDEWAHGVIHLNTRTAEVHVDKHSPSSEKAAADQAAILSWAKEARDAMTTDTSDDENPC